MGNSDVSAGGNAGIVLLCLVAVAVMSGENRVLASGKPAKSLTPARIARSWESEQGCYELLDRLEQVVSPGTVPDLSQLDVDFLLVKGITYCQLAAFKHSELPLVALERLMEIGTDNINRALQKLRSLQSDARVKWLEAMYRFWLDAYMKMKQTASPALLDHARLEDFLSLHLREIRSLCSSSRVLSRSFACQALCLAAKKQADQK